MIGKHFFKAAGGVPLAVALVVASTPANAQSTRDVNFQNDCSHPVRILVAHAFDENTWDAHGWYEYSAYEGTSTLEVDGEPLTQLTDHSIFFYAETTDGADIFWEGEDHYETYEDVSYGMVKASVEVKSGKFNVRLTCDDVGE